MRSQSTFRALLTVAVLSVCSASGNAATGDMGTGIPVFATYGAATGVQTIIWGLEQASIPMAAGCERLYLTPATMGADSYKIAVATLMAARLSNRRVRLYAHAERDGGCGIDYIQLN
jgi:hypothetical protein